MLFTPSIPTASFVNLHLSKDIGESGLETVLYREMKGCK